MGLISGMARGGDSSNPLQHSCLENPMDREAWQATVHRAPQSPSMEISQGNKCGHPGQDCRLPCYSGRHEQNGSSQSDTQLFRFPKSLYLSTCTFSLALSTTNGASQVAQWLKKKQAWQRRRCKRCGFDPWIRKIPRVGNGNPAQYSCLENPMDRGETGLQSMGSQRVSVTRTHTHTYTYHRQC